MVVCKHYTTQVSKYVWICTKCYKPFWTPNTFGESDLYSRLIQSRGSKEALKLITQNTPASVELIQCIEQVGKIRDRYSDKEFSILIKCISESFAPKVESDFVINPKSIRPIAHSKRSLT